MTFLKYLLCILIFFFPVLSSCRDGENRKAISNCVDDIEEMIDSEGLHISKDKGPDIKDLTPEAEAWSDSVLRHLTLEERIGQLFLPAVYAESDEASMRQLRSYCADLHVGGVVLLKGNPESVREIAMALQSNSAAPPFIAMDAEWGLGMRLRNTPVFPRNGMISEAADQGLMYDYGREVARECRIIGINMILGPVADVTAGKGIMGTRSFGSEPKRVADLSVAYARGLEDGNIISVAKHFPGHGGASADSHKGLAVVSGNKKEIEERALYPFRVYISAGLSGVMAGHLAVPSMDSTMCPASFSPFWMRDVLRDQLGFRGLVMTDAMNMEGATRYSAADALMAGVDIILAPENTKEEIREIASKITSGVIPISVINDRCRRILVYKYLVKRQLPLHPEGDYMLRTAASDSIGYLLREGSR